MSTVRINHSMGFEDKEVPFATFNKLNSAYQVARGLEYDAVIVFWAIGPEYDWIECRVGRNHACMGSDILCV